MRRSEINKKQPALALANRGTPEVDRPGKSSWRMLRRAGTVLATALALSLYQFGAGLISPASAASPLNVFVGYFDTHSVGFSSNQPNPWPYKDASSFDGSPCPTYPNSTNCWDAGAIRLDNPGNTAVTGVQVVITIGSETYALWSNQTVKANGTLVLTETGTSPNSENFDGSDEPPNSYNGGLMASCVNSGAIPDVKITIAGVMTSYLDTGQVLNTGGVDGGHCLNGKFVSGRMDESRPWAQIGAASATAPSAPQSLAATAGSGSVSLTWTPPASNGGAAITGYNVYRGTSAGGESATPIATNVTGTSFTDTGLINGTTYYYKVAAVNSAGVSPQSNEASATPVAVQATVPSPPQSLTAKAGNGSVNLSWSAPGSNGGSPVTGYNVYRGTSAGGESATPIATNVTGTSFNDTSVNNGTTYYYTVAAVNAVGVSLPSNEASATPQATVPSTPSGLVASGGNGSVALSWTIPTSDGGSPITGYDVYRGTSASGESATPIATNVATNSFTDTSVTNGTTYYYKVAAVNAVGVSPQSNEASATPQQPATVPSAPQSVAAAGGNGSVRLSWSAPASNGGAAVTGYDVYRGTSAGGESATPIATNVTGTSFIDTGLTNGTTYYYTVTAINAVGMSPQSSEAPATPRPTVPSAPLSAVAAAGNASVTVSWSVPASDGGSAITGYDVYRGTGPGGESAAPIATNVTGASFTDAGLTNGTTYYYKMAAVNAVGVSAQSNEASATPQQPATVPSAPQSLAAAGGNGSVSLSWSAPSSNGGSPVTGYDVYRGTGPGGESATPIATNVATASFTDPGLTSGTTYYYKVAAVNAVGVSPQSNEASATPQAPSAAFVRRAGSATASASKTTISVPVSAPGVAAGHTLVVSLLLSSTTTRTGAVSVTDSAGNSYVLARDNNDGSAGDRTMIFVSVGVKALAAGGSITLAYPSSAETHVSVDEFSGITGIDTSAGATGTAAAFSSGTAPVTTQAQDVLVGVIGIESGKVPAWANGWASLPALSVSTDFLDTAYQLATAAGGYAASGTTSGQWMASIVTFKTS
jgi:fibronectin type 3 domain-containing protein